MVGVAPVASRAAVVGVAVKVDIAEAIAVIDTEFSTLEPKKLPKAMKWKEKKLKGVQRDTVYYPGE